MSAYDTFGSTALPDDDPDGVQAERDAETDDYLAQCVTHDHAFCLNEHYGENGQPMVVVRCTRCGMPLCDDCAAGRHEMITVQECGCPCHGGA